MPILTQCAPGIVRTITEISAQQAGLVTRQQLLNRGLSSAIIERRRREGMLDSVHAGVYTVGPVRGLHSREHAALLACRGGIISHVSAACFHKLLSESRDRSGVHITLPANAHARRRPGIHAHRCNLADDETMLLEGLPVTTPARTIYDLAAVSTDDMAKALIEAERRQPDIRLQVMALLERYPAARGTRALSALLSDAARAFTRSDLEDVLQSLIRSAGLPPCETNVKVCGAEVDCYWRQAGVVVEVDGFEFHGTRDAFIRDRERDSALAAAGLIAMRLTWDQLTKHRDRTLVQLALALSRSGSALPATNAQSSGARRRV